MCRRWWRSRSRRHDTLDDVLVDQAEHLQRLDEDEPCNGDLVAAGGTTSTKNSSSGGGRLDSVRTGVHTNPGRRSDTTADPSPADGAAAGPPSTSVIMMYSQYLPSVDEQRSAADLDNYYSRIDTEETVKCVVTSVLFCTVVVLIVLVALFINPGMWLWSPLRLAQCALCSVRYLNTQVFEYYLNTVTGIWKRFSNTSPKNVGIY